VDKKAVQLYLMPTFAFPSTIVENFVNSTKFAPVILRMGHKKVR
jgi:hypothetical protein